MSDNLCTAENILFVSYSISLIPKISRPHFSTLFIVLFITNLSDLFLSYLLSFQVSDERFLMDEIKTGFIVSG